MSGGCAERVGAGGSLSLCLPVLPLPGGLKVPPSRAKGGGGTRPPSNASLGDKCHLHHLLQQCEVAGGALRGGGDGRDSVTLGKGSAAVEQDTNTDHRVPWGQRGGGH